MKCQGRFIICHIRQRFLFDEEAWWSNRLCLNSPLLCLAAACRGPSPAVVQVGGLCRSRSCSPVACLPNFPPMDPLLGPRPNSGLGGSRDVPVFDICRSTATSPTLQPAVKPGILQVHQHRLRCIPPAPKALGRKLSQVIISLSPPAQSSSPQCLIYMRYDLHSFVANDPINELPQLLNDFSGLKEPPYQDIIFDAKYVLSSFHFLPNCC